MNQSIFQTLLLSTVGPLVLLIGTLITLYFTYWSKRHEEILEHKRAMYDRLLQPYAAILHQILAVKRGVKPSIERKMGEFQELSLLMPLHVPDRVFRAFQNVQQKGIKWDSIKSSSSQNELQEAAKDYFLALGDLLLEVRRDLGYNRTSITGVDIMRNIFHDIDKFV